MEKPYLLWDVLFYSGFSCWWVTSSGFLLSEPVKGEGSTGVLAVEGAYVARS